MPGTAIVLAVAAVVCLSIYGWRFLPGLLGEWVGFMVGLMTTPFLLEFSFLFLGLMLVVFINHWRRSREGDDFVTLEQVTERDAGLPDHAGWAVFRSNALPGETPTLLARAEGAMAVGDHPTAVECLSEMSPAELALPETLRLRIELAKATGNAALAERLERLLDGVPEDGCSR